VWLVLLAKPVMTGVSYRETMMLRLTGSMRSWHRRHLRDQAIQRNVVYEGDLLAIREQHDQLVVANRNAELMAVSMMQQRNEAWY
jgi:hypothetical protein